MLRVGWAWEKDEGVELQRGFSASLSVLYGVAEDRCAWSDLGRAGLVSRGGKRTARSGYTALISACAYGHTEAARLLVEKGADLEAQITSAGNCVSGDAVASDPDSAFGWLAPDSQSRVSLGIG